MPRPLVLHLVRHGETTWHRAGRVQGQWSGPGEPVLTPAGLEQARAAGRELRERVDAGAVRIVSSDQTRAVQTAEVLARELGEVTDPVRLDPAWREQRLGSLEGRVAAELVAEPVPDGLDVSEVAWGGGESMRAVHERVAVWLRTEVAGLGPGDLVVVSHEHTIRAALAVLADRGCRDIDWDAPVPPGSVRSVPLRH